jgi:TetR/AcrR family transcriptional regulator, ethionamide resistance regulator
VRVAVLSKGSGTDERRREAKASLLEATERLLAHGGSYADLSVERIAVEAGRSRTAFYLYFRDKRDLLMRLTEAVAAQLYEVADRWWSGDDGREDLRRALAEVLATYHEHRDALRAVVEASTYDEEVGELWRGLLARFIEATEERLAAIDGANAALPGRAFALVWMTERSCYQHVVREPTLSDGELIEALHEIWARAIYG